MPWIPAPRITTTLTGIIRIRMDMVARKRLKLRMKKIPKPSPSASPAIATMTPRPFKGGPLRYLITGGAGFIGSHLAERLLDRGDRVVLLDNLSTGSVDNIRHLKSSDHMQYHLDNIENRQLLAELVDDADVIVHLAAAVGVKLIVESPVKTIETNVNGTQLILEAACKKKKLPVIVARLFNTVGPRQTGRYGMVFPNFVKSALDNTSISVYGSGKQSRCFCDVRDTVEGLIRLK